MASSLSKGKTTPTARRSRWFAPRPGEWDLAYLGWGARFYGINPVPVKRAEYWSYQLILSGNPILTFGKSARPVSPGELFLFGEGCDQGWTDKPDGRAELLVWLWRSPPRCRECIPSHGGCLRWTVPPRLIRKLQQNHAKCRQEVAGPDALTPLTLDHLRLELELCLGRLRLSKPPPPAASNRLDLAISWMQQNLAVRRPVSFLCDYLQVSPSSLERLFRSSVGESPSEYFHRLKMQQAAQLLKQDSLSVKEIGFTLGYSHANDFSRAFKTHTGRTPEQQRRAPSPERSARLSRPLRSDLTAAG
jgi:AraC-like DNA-binding protein